jgi:hypothetical protein
LGSKKVGAFTLAFCPDGGKTSFLTAMVELGSSLSGRKIRQPLTVSALYAFLIGKEGYGDDLSATD